MSTKDRSFQEQLFFNMAAATGSGFATALPVHCLLTRIGKLVHLYMSNNGTVLLVNDTSNFFKFTAAIPAGWRPRPVLTASVSTGLGLAWVGLNNLSSNPTLCSVNVDPSGDLYVFPHTVTADTPGNPIVGAALDVDFSGVNVSLTHGFAFWTTE